MTGEATEFSGGLPAQGGVEFEALNFPPGPQRLRKSLRARICFGATWPRPEAAVKVSGLTVPCLPLVLWLHPSYLLGLELLIVMNSLASQDEDKGHQQSFRPPASQRDSSDMKLSVAHPCPLPSKELGFKF